MTSPTLPTHDRPDDVPPAVDLSRAPLPTAGTLRRRRSVSYQLTRFAVFNARIMRMVLHSSH